MRLPAQPQNVGALGVPVTLFHDVGAKNTKYGVMPDGGEPGQASGKEYLEPVRCGNFR
jgi:hypothetical protein